MFLESYRQNLRHCRFLGVFTSSIFSLEMHLINFYRLATMTSTYDAAYDDSTWRSSSAAFDRSGTVSLSCFRANVPTCQFSSTNSNARVDSKRCVETLEQWRRGHALSQGCFSNPKMATLSID